MSNEEQSKASDGECKIEIFAKKDVRKTLFAGEWWFSVTDVLEALTGTPDGNRYSRDLRRNDPSLGKRWDELTRTLPFRGAGGVREMTFINIEGIFRMMQSVPSARAEPFKKWLARVGFERLEEINNPELAIQRAIALYRAKGYPDDWIDARIRNKASREVLEREWKDRGVKGDYYGLLTDTIHVETFGIHVQDHKAIKGLKSQNLRDNMTPIELTLTTLGEQATTEIIKSTDPDTLERHKKAAKQGGGIAGKARKEIEDVTGKHVISKENYLTDRQKANNIGPSLEINQILDRMLKSGRNRIH